MICRFFIDMMFVAKAICPCYICHFNICYCDICAVATFVGAIFFVLTCVNVTFVIVRFVLPRFAVLSFVVLIFAFFDSGCSILEQCACLVKREKLAQSFYEPMHTYYLPSLEKIVKDRKGVNLLLTLFYSYWSYVWRIVMYCILLYGCTANYGRSHLSIQKYK